jgi:hypothetical protein
MGPGIACPFEISGYADSILVDYAMAHRAIAYCRRVAEGRREDNRAGGPFHEMMTFQSANGTSSRQMARWIRLFKSSLSAVSPASLAACGVAY